MEMKKCRLPYRSASIQHSELNVRQNMTLDSASGGTSSRLADRERRGCRTTTLVWASDPSKSSDCPTLISGTLETINTLIFIHSPYAYNFGLGKRADAEEAPTYDDDSEFYADDKAGLNLENWENGGYMDNKNDIDVIDYDLIGYPSRECFVAACLRVAIIQFAFFYCSLQTFTAPVQFWTGQETCVRLWLGQAKIQ